MLSRLITRHRFRAASAAVGALLAVGAIAGPASAQPEACAATIGKNLRKLAKTGQANQSKCHKLANKLCLGSAGVCNDLNSLAFQIVDKNKYELTKQKGLAKIGETCSAAPTVLANYPGDSVSNVTEFIDDLVTERADVILGDSNLNCEEAKVDCFSTISKQRAALADKMLNTAIKCQSDEIPGAALNLDCLDSSIVQSAIDKAAIKITDACGVLTGADVGTCDPLPGCITAAAIAEGQLAATRTYPNTTCGDTPTANARTASIDINTPADLGGLTLEVEYPRFAMGLPGTGSGIDFGDFSNYTVAFLSPFDLDGTLRIAAVDFAPITSGQFVDVTFDTCNPLTLGHCVLNNSIVCDDDVDCGVNGPCAVENAFCSVSQFTNCGDAPLPGCPVGEICSAQQSLTSCTVVSASDTFGNPVDGVTCTVSLTEP